MNSVIFHGFDWKNDRASLPSYLNFSAIVRFGDSRIPVFPARNVHRDRGLSAISEVEGHVRFRQDGIDKSEQMAFFPFDDNPLPPHEQRGLPDR